MSLSNKPTKRLELHSPAPSVFQQQWFIEMLPSPINGEVRLRMHRPSAWVRVADAAELITCSIQKIHNLCEEGELRWRWLDHKGAGGTKLILVDSVQQYLVKKSPRQAAVRANSLR